MTKHTLKPPTLHATMGLRSVTHVNHRALAALALLVASLGLTGCAALTNPVANGVPVRMLPDELLGESREGYEAVNLSMLRVPPPEEFLLAAGDTLGIYIEGVIGNESTPPPVNLPASADMPPSIGYPFPVRDDGVVSLPLIGSVNVAGMTIEQAEQAVIDAYLGKQIIREEDFRIIVTLLRPRTVRVLVVREDGGSPNVTVRSEGLIGFGDSVTSVGGGSTARGNTLELPIYENDLLNALTNTGGVPNSAAAPEVIIYRGYTEGDALPQGYSGQLPPAVACDCDPQDGRQVIRIPLRKRCGTTVNIPRENILLQDGDIITLRTREAERYYTGGLLPSNEQTLPLDYDVTVVEAVLRARGPLVNGGVNSSNLNGNIVGGGLGNPSPNLLSVLRRLPNGQQVNIHVNLEEALRDPRLNILVQNDDVLLLQEERDQALARYFFNSVFRMDFFFRMINRQDAQGSTSFVLP